MIITGQSRNKLIYPWSITVRCRLSRSSKEDDNAKVRLYLLDRDKPHCIFSFIFWLIALAFSVFYGLKACDIFPREEEIKNLALKVHLAWFNFIGSVVGWAVLWILTRRYWAYIIGGSAAVDPNLWDLLAGFIAFVGITGYLPGTVNYLIFSGLNVADSLMKFFLKLPYK